MRSVFVFVFQMMMLGLTPMAQAQDPAHALAQKFAVDDAKPAAKAPAPAPKPSAPPAAKAAPAAPARAASPKDYETEMLEAARAEAEARAGKLDPRPADAPSANSAATATPAAAPATSAAKSVPRAPAAPVQIKIDALIKTPAPAASAATGTAARNVSSSRASVLLVLSEPADGYDAAPDSFDPIICIAEQCYVSNGSGADAKPVARSEALSTRNTFRGGAGACAGKRACAFRGVTMAASGQMQIVNLGLVKHGSHEIAEAKIDVTCGVDQGDLVCNSPFTAPDYRVWIVPEELAASVGVERIEAALDGELAEENVTLATDK